MAIDDESVTPGELPAINEVPIWEEHLPAVITGVQVRGGDTGEGAANFQARVLDKRTRWLKEQLEALSGGGIILVGHLDTQEELDAIPTEGLQVGTAYFLNYAIRVWNGATWGDSGSLRGERGINLLGVWPDAVPLPERTENEIGDAYIWQNDIHVLVPLPGNWEALGIRGADGKSSFDLWKEIPGNENKTIDEYWEDQKGPEGPGAFETWLAQPGNAGKTEADFLLAQKGIQGDEGPPRAAFEVDGTVANTAALPRPGDAAKAYYIGVDLYVWVTRLTDYVKIPGIHGKSAFEIWQENGHAEGTLEEFLDDMKGTDGAGIFLIGPLSSQEELDAIDTTNLLVGTAYFVEYALRVWDGTVWRTSGSLRGNRGINLLGKWPDGIALPEITENEVGDAYLWNNDIWILSFNPIEWEALGIRGADGKTAYEVWEEIPENNGKTLTQYFASLKGEKGDSPYQEWEKQPGNNGKSYAEWIETIRGFKGDQGDPRAAFVIAGIKANTGALPRPGDETKAWYVGIDLYVWVTADSDYVMIPGVKGMSAYEQWLLVPENEGKTEVQFLASLIGPKGADSQVPGPKGDDGRNFRIISTLANEDALAAVQNPEDQDAYALLDTGHLWLYLTNPAGWVDLGPWRGVDGKSAYQIWQEDGHEGQPISAFWAYLKGADGQTITLKGALDLIAELPSVGNVEQDVWAVRENNSFYGWVEGAWLNLGTYGKDGAAGKDGKSLDIIKILTEEDQSIPAAVDANKGKAYLDLDKFVWVNINNVWQNAGKFVGDQGEIGPMGTAMKPRGTVGTVSQLPPLNTVEEGDLWYTADTKLGYVKVDGVWSDPIDNIGPQGIQGEDGPPGALMPILGLKASMAQLQTDHPTGTAGDAWLITNGEIRNLAVWNTDLNAWQDTGPAGIPGQRGLPGQDSTVPGPKGDKGSQWLTLTTHDAPSNTFNGRVGDWAVNLDNKIFYKDLTQGWIYWGTLVAGDVNSPLLSEGKVVRHGNEWVPVPVDEVPTPQAGEVYGRKLKDGSSSETEWVKIVFPITDIPDDDGKKYYRIWKVGAEKPIWEELVFPTVITDLQVQDDTKQYVRVFLTGAQVPAWAEINFSGAGIQDIANPEDGAVYMRLAKTKTWVKYVPAPSDGKQYLQKDGNWISFDRYDMPILAMSATGSVDPKVNQVVALDNSGSTAKTITLGDGPKAGSGIGARAQTLIVTVTGAAGVVSFAATGATVLSWHGGTPPTLSGSVTNIVFWWTGTRWIGQLGAVVP